MVELPRRDARSHRRHRRPRRLRGRGRHRARLPARPALAAVGPAGCSRSARTRKRRGSRACRSSATPRRPSCCRGALAGLAGFMFLARFGNITVTAGQGLELQVGRCRRRRRRQHLRRRRHGHRRAARRDPDRHAAAEPDPLARGERVLAGRDPRRCSSCSRSPSTVILGRLRTALGVAGAAARPTRARRSARGARCVSAGPACAPGRAAPRRSSSWSCWSTPSLLAVLPGTVQNYVEPVPASIEKVIVVVIMTFVIINGEIDLSVASVMGFWPRVVACADERGRAVRAGDRRRAARRRAAGLVKGFLSRSSACPRWSSRSPA